MSFITSADREYMRQQSLPYYVASIDADMSSDLEVNYIGLVDRPAIERNFQAFKAITQRAKFTVDDDKHVISGPAMIADLPIYRNDAQLGEYYVVFDKASIRSIVEKFSAKGYLKNFNLFHDQQQRVTDVTIFNSFISDKSIGINGMKGFEDVADGSWFISAKVNNPTVWADVKAGTIKGFSVEGLFNYLPVKKFVAMPQPTAASQMDTWIYALRAEMAKYPAVRTNVEGIFAKAKEGREAETLGEISKILRLTAPTAHALWNKIVNA